MTHSNQVSYCPTANCGQVYPLNSSTGKRVVLCDCCNAYICTSCKANEHFGLSCMEFADPQSWKVMEDKLKQFMQQHGYKACPVCKVPIYKVDGCDHVTCHCGAHVCWRCMASFKSGNETYSHMSSCKQK